MTCQHTLYASEESRIAAPWENEGEICFQPIVDTFEHRILAHRCLTGPPDFQTGGGLAVQAARIRSHVIHAVGARAGKGLYFLNLVPSSIDDPAMDMSSTIEAVFDAGLRPGNVVFESMESDLARDPPHSRRIREYLRRRGFGLAVTQAGIGADRCSFQTARDFAPEYIHLDRRLTGNLDEPVCAGAIGRLVRIADTSGARVVAEGVDRLKMVENLWLLGVRFMQGHLFGEPSSRIA